MKFLLYSLALLGLLPGCQPDQTVLNKESVINEVKIMLDNYHRDIRKEGLTGEFKYLDQSADFFWVPPDYEVTLSYDSVRAILEASAPAFKLIEFEWDTLKIYPLTDKIANYSGIVSGTMTDTAGVINQVRIIESGTLIRRPDGWKLLSGQSANL